MWHGALSVFRFELRRTITVSRVAVWLMLILFPVFIVSVMKQHEAEIEKGLLEELFDTPQIRMQRELVRKQTVPEAVERDRDATQTDRDMLLNELTLDDAAVRAGEAGQVTEDELPNYMDQLWGFVFFGLIPEVITLFGLLLWVPALVHAELEGRTWIYMAVRPRGRVSVLLGKYLTALAWTALAGWISATICVLVAKPEHALRLWGTIVTLVALACAAYGAIYSLIGVWLHRRAMVVAVAYTLIFEFLVSFIPAVINKFTVQYRLRNLLFTWMDWWDFVPAEATNLFLGTERAWVHVAILSGIVVGVLAVAVQVIQRREYATVTD